MLQFHELQQCKLNVKCDLFKSMTELLFQVCRVYYFIVIILGIEIDLAILPLKSRPYGTIQITLLLLYFHY